MPGFGSPRRYCLFAALLVVSLCQLGAGLAVARQTGALVSRLAESGSAASSELAALGAMAGAVFVCELMRRWTTEALGLDYARTVRLALYRHLLRMPLNHQRKRSRGGQILPFVGDLTALRLWWSDGIARGSSAVVIALGVLGWLATEDWRVGVTVGAVFVCCLLIMGMVLRPFARAVRLQRQLRGGLVTLISDRVAAPALVQALGGVRRELNRAASRNRRMDRASLRRAGWSGMMRGLAATFPVLAALLLLGPSRGGELSLQELVASLAMIGILSNALSDLERAFELAVPARIAKAKIVARFAEGTAVASITGTGLTGRRTDLLELRGLALGEGSAPFSTSVQRGDIVLVDSEAGPSGAADLMAALAGLALPAQGEVLVQGRVSHGLSQRRRRQSVGIATPWLPLLRDQAQASAMYRHRGSSATVEPGVADALLISDLLEANPVLMAGDAGHPAHELAGLHLLRALQGSPRLLLLEEPERNLVPAQLQYLASLLSQWRGAVILATDCGLLRALANRTWQLSGGEIAELTQPAEPYRTITGRKCQ